MSYEHTWINFGDLAGLSKVAIIWMSSGGLVVCIHGISGVGPNGVREEARTAGLDRLAIETLPTYKVKI